MDELLALINDAAASHNWPVVAGGVAVLAVLAFHFPEYLTTPDLRKKYDVGLLRQVLTQLAERASTTDTLTADALATLQAAAGDYDFDRLSQHARTLLAGPEALPSFQPETTPP